MKKKIYVKVTDIVISKGAVNNMKVELTLNNNSVSKTLLYFPFDEYALFEVTSSSLDNILEITYHYTINSNTTYFQVNKYEIKMSPKFLSKECEKTLAINFKMDKPTSLMIDKSSTEVQVNSSIYLILLDENSFREKIFKEKNKNLKLAKTGTVQERSGKQLGMTEKEKNDINSYGEESEEEENVLNGEEINEPGRNRLKSEIVRKSLKIDYESFNFNTSCRRCNYLERLILAQQKDILALQSQVECFIQGNYSDEKINIESEAMLKEPVFAKIFQKDEVEQTPSPKKHNLSNSGSFKKSESANMKVLQKSGEEINIYTLDEDRVKRIQKYEQEIDNLRSQLFAMTEKLKSLEQVKSENDQLREQIAKASATRASLDKQLIDTSYSYQSQIKNNLNEIEKLVNGKKSLELANTKLTVENLNMNNDTQKLMIRIKELENELSINKAKIDVNVNQNNINAIIAQNTKIERTRADKNDEILKVIADLNNKVNDLRAENQKLASENAAMGAKYKELESQYQGKVRDILDKQKKIVELETNFLLVKAEHLNSTEIAKHRDELQGKFNRLMEINFNIREDFSNANKSYIEQTKILNEKISILENEIIKLRVIISEKSTQSTEKQGTIDMLEHSIEKFNLEISDLNAKKLYAYTSDENNKILNETIKQIFDYNAKIINEINEFADYMIKSADKNMTAQHYIRVLLRKLYQKENELKESRKYLDMAKSMDIITSKDDMYYAMKQDQIDVKLGELINAYPSRSRIKSKFIRDSRGNYRYGGKKLAISVEGAKLLIRYGNNLMGFDDFIDRYGEEPEILEEKKIIRSISPIVK